MDRVVALAGCPGGTVGDRVPHFGAGGWLPYLEGVYQRQWEEQIAPYWSGLAEFAAAENPGLRVCLELHPGTCVFNVETFRRVAALGPAIAGNLDPSHFFWMGMDGHKVAAALGDRIGHVHGKDTAFHTESLALNGLLDRRWPEPAAQMPWTFAVPGRGHDLAWWTGLVRALADSAPGSSRSSTRIRSCRPPPAFPRPRGCCGRRSSGSDAARAGVSGRLRVGLIGTGIIAQVMHLHFLRELADRFEIAALCDSRADAPRPAPRVRRGRRAHRLARDAARAPRRGARADLGQPRADRRGGGARRAARLHREAHVLLDREGGRWSTRPTAAGVTLMVGYPKRYDPAFARFAEVARLDGRGCCA